MVTKKDVEYLAELAKIELSEQEREGYAGTLNALLEYADMLNEVDTDHVQPVDHIVDVENVFREDVVRPSMRREEILRNAPDKDKGCFRVPRFIE